jgi:hypothetical protein
MNKRILVLAFGSFLMVTAYGCHKADSVTEQAEPAGTPAKPAASPLVGFAKDLQFIKNGGYSYVYVFARKDGKPLASEDSQALRKEAPQMVDCVTTDEGKKAICGTNFNLEEGNMGTLKKRFVVEDYSGK